MRVSPAEPAAPTLPQPGPDALAHSAQVTAFVRGLVIAGNGWISFADYMNAVLYAPGLGYYVSGARKFGAAGDFITAPEITPLYAQTLAATVASVLDEVAGDVIELGPGSGRLAVDMLAALARRDALPLRYRLLEVSPELRARQRALLESRVPELMSRVDWLDVLPPRWRGVVLANEVLDAVPPHIVVRSKVGWQERGVALDDGNDDSAGLQALVLADRPLASTQLLALATERFPASPRSYMSELNPAAEALVGTLAAACAQGVLLAIDYGYPAADYYHPERSAGTLMAHYRHHAIENPLFLPGLVDLTAHVDFSAMATAGAEAGMEVAGFATQAAFLMESGIAGALDAVGDPRSIDYLRGAAAVNTLVSPSAMGERFKVLALTKGLSRDVRGFGRNDQSHRL